MNVLHNFVPISRLKAVGYVAATKAYGYGDQFFLCGAAAI